MTIEINELKKLIFDKNLSYEEIGRLNNCSGNNIRKLAKRKGLNLPNRRKINKKENFNKGNGRKNFCEYCGLDITHKPQNKYCNHYCHNKQTSNKKYLYFLTKPHEYQRSNFNTNLVKRFILEEQNNKCDICGMSNEWNNKPLVFIIDHIDGDASHNTRENFRCICPNCDSQLDTFKSKNKNGSRYYYRYKNKTGG